jgi:hypothetical protein
MGIPVFDGGALLLLSVLIFKLSLLVLDSLLLRFPAFVSTLYGRSLQDGI